MENYKYYNPDPLNLEKMSEEELDKYIRRQRLLAEAKAIKESRAEKADDSPVKRQRVPAEMQDREMSYEERLREAKARQALRGIKSGMPVNNR